MFLGDSLCKRKWICSPDLENPPICVDRSRFRKNRNRPALPITAAQTLVQLLQLDQVSRLAVLLGQIATDDRLRPTLVDGVEVFRAFESMPRTPIVNQPRILIVGQGRKRAYLSGEEYVYHPNRSLLLSVPLPADCETEASPEEPLLLLAIHIEQAMVGEMMLELAENLPSPTATPVGIASTPMTDEMASAVIRLLVCLQSPSDSRILGRQMVREVV